MSEMKELLRTAARSVRSVSGPSSAANVRVLRARGKTVAALQIRDATEADNIRALAALHVTTWNDMHGRRRSASTEKLRERQWRAVFDSLDCGWFGLIVVRPNGDLVH